MQVKSIAAPVEVRVTQPSPSAFFLADGTEVSSFTQSLGDAEAGLSVWVGLPFGREMLAAAVMVPDSDFAVSMAQLAAMSTDEFRAWVLGAFLHVGSCAATMSAGRSEFRSGFAGDPALAEFYALLSARLDTDLFATATPATTTPASRPAPAARKCRRGRAARSAA